MKLAILVSALSLLALPAAADKAASKEAGGHYDKGLSLYEAKDFEKAIAELKTAYQLDPKPEYLFAWAQAERLSGDCEQAIALYKQLLADKKTGRELAERVRELEKKCEETLAANAPIVEPPSPRPTDGGGDQAIDGSDEPKGPARVWWKDPLGGALVGTGLLATGLGVTFWVLSRSSLDDARAAQANHTSYDLYSDSIEKAKSQRTIAIVGLTAGGALIAGGAVRYFLLSRGGTTTVGMLYDGGQGLLVVGGGF